MQFQFGIWTILFIQSCTSHDSTHVFDGHLWYPGQTDALRVLLGQSVHFNETSSWEGDSDTVFTSEKRPDDQWMPTVGNGHVATVAKTPYMFMNGIYNGEAGQSSRAEIPSPVCIEMLLDGSHSFKKEYKMDVAKGVFFETWNSSDFVVQQRWYAHRIYTRVVLYELHVTTSIRLRFEPRSCMQDSHDINFQQGPSGADKIRYMFGRSITAEYPDLVNLYPLVNVFYDALPTVLFFEPGAYNEKKTFIASVSTDKADAFDMYQKVKSMVETDTVYNTHVQAWANIWQRGRIDIRGNHWLAKAVYGCFYYLMSSLPLVPDPIWPFYGLSPGGLAHGAGNDYLGHVFWDQDLWMYPGLLAFHPDVAREILRMRVSKLPGARYKAKKQGYRGAMFPWESAFSGRETTPGEIYADYEIHINGDISLAARNYFYMSQDSQFFSSEGGKDLVEGIAEFWASKSSYNKAAGRWEILNVMPPDEWHVPVNNSAFTNAVAASSLLLPSLLARDTSVTFQNMSHYTEIAQGMYVPYDPANDYHPEFEGYTLGTQVKQADAILLQFPLLWPMNDSTRRSDAEIYEKYTTRNGPAMTWGIFSICALEQGNKQHANELFVRNYDNIRPPFFVWSEYPGGGGAVNFATGMGNFLQNLVFGYAGMRMYDGHVTLQPQLPVNATGVTYTGLTYLGNELTLDVAADETYTLEVVQASTTRLCVQQPNKPDSPINPGTSYGFDRLTKITLKACV